MTADSPFTALGLTPSAHLSDEQVHAAWLAIATATHPDRPDGGDPARYARASAAHEQLKTAWGRSETLADMQAAQTPHVRLPGQAAAGTGPGTGIRRALVIFPARVRHGRPARIAARAVIAAAAAFAAVTVAPGTPAAPAVVAGCALWLVLTGRHDLAPPPGR